MKQYNDLARRILTEGHAHPDRTNVGRISLYGETLRFKMKDGFPIVTCRNINYEAAFKEMLWFISGSSDIKDLDSKIWDPWAVTDQDVQTFFDQHFKNRPEFLEEFSEEMVLQDLKNTFVGSIGPMYGVAWRNTPAINYVEGVVPDVSESDMASDRLEKLREYFENNKIPSGVSPEQAFQELLNHSYYRSVDQLHALITGLKNNPYGSRHVMTTWIPSWIPFNNIELHQNPMYGRGVLAPCHILVQCHVIPPDEEHTTPRLILQLYQRSADFMVGSAFNIAQYALLLHLLARVTGYEAYEFIYNLGDVHIYKNQIEQVQEQLSREPLELPTLELSGDFSDLFKVTIDQIKVTGYNPHPGIKYPVAV